jgi:hypothetical protein
MQKYYPSKKYKKKIFLKAFSNSSDSRKLLTEL